MYKIRAAFKIVLLGDTASKTTLVNRYLTGFFDESIKMTIGADFCVKNLEIDGQKVKLQIWDFGGEERFKVLLPRFVKGADGALFIYDIANFASINNIDDWLSIIRKEDRAEVPILLVGIMSNEKNKRQVSVEDGKEIAKSKNLNGFIECSVRTGENVEEAFEALTRLMVANKGINFKYLEEKLNRNEDLVERMMSEILKLPDLVDESFATLNQKIAALESRINGISNQKSTTFTKDGDQPTRPSSGGSRGAFPVNQSIKLFKINPDGTTTNIESDGPIKEILSSEECYVIVSDEYRKVYLWKGVNSNVRSKFIGAKRSQDIRGQVGMHFGVVPFDEGDEDPDFINLIGGRPHRFGDEDRFPYPYVFKPPEPPDDLALAPGVQLHTSPKKKDPDERINCQFCGRKLTMEEQISHSCKEKP